MLWILGLVLPGLALMILHIVLHRGWSLWASVGMMAVEAMCPPRSTSRTLGSPARCSLVERGEHQAGETAAGGDARLDAVRRRG